MAPGCDSPGAVEEFQKFLTTEGLWFFYSFMNRTNLLY